MKSKSPSALTAMLELPFDDTTRLRDTRYLFSLPLRYQQHFTLMYFIITSFLRPIVPFLLSP